MAAQLNWKFMWILSWNKSRYKFVCMIELQPETHNSSMRDLHYLPLCVVKYMTYIHDNKKYVEVLLK